MTAAALGCGALYMLYSRSAAGPTATADGVVRLITGGLLGVALFFVNRAASGVRDVACPMAGSLPDMPWVAGMGVPLAVAGVLLIAVSGALRIRGASERAAAVVLLTGLACAGGAIGALLCVEPWDSPCPPPQPDL